MKYGFKTILRTKIKTLSFIILIALVSGFLALGAGMFQSSETMLDEADAVFMTAGEFIYTGGHYPHSGLYDEALQAARKNFDYERYAGSGAVLLEEHVSRRIYIEGYRPRPRDMPHEYASVMTLVMGGQIPSSDYFSARGDKIHYGESDQFFDGQLFAVHPEVMAAYNLVPGRKYVVFAAAYARMGSRQNSLDIVSFDNYLHMPAEYGVCESVIDVTGCDMEEFWESDAGQYFRLVIDKLWHVNRSVDAVVSWDIKAVDPFHRGDYTLMEGTFPGHMNEPFKMDARETASPYKKNINACVIPYRIAAQLGLGVGDRMEIFVHYPTLETGLYDSYSPVTGFAAVEDFEIAGIYKSDDYGTPPVYILDTGQEWAAASANHYTLARAVVKNREAERYMRYIAPLLPADISFGLFNQGYEGAARAIFSMRETAVLIMGICAAAGCVVLWFFAYLFVYRSGNSVKILLRLGSTEKRTLLYLLTGSGIVAALAAALGSILSFFISRRVIKAVYEAAESGNAFDYRFSIMGYGAQIETFAPSPEISQLVYLGISLAVFGLAVILCGLLGIKVIRDENAHFRFRKAARKTFGRGNAVNKNTVRKPEGYVKSKIYDRIPGVSSRYMARSMFRSGWRSLSVPVLFTALLFFVFAFGNMREGYKSRLATVYGDVPVTLTFTAVDKSAQRNYLRISPEQIQEMEETGYVKDGWRFTASRAMYLGVLTYADGREADKPPQNYIIPRDSHTYETFKGQLEFMTHPMTSANHYWKMPDFAQNSAADVVWLEGWRRESFDGYELDSAEYAPCLMPRNLMEERGLSNGDIIAFSVFYTDRGVWLNYLIHYKIAGHYINELSRNTILLPDRILNASIPLPDSEGNEAELYYHGGGFTLTRTENLSGFKDWLSERYDTVGRWGPHRRWVLIDDKALYHTIESLNRHIGYMDLLYPVMLGAIAAIGFIASSLLLKSRGKEIAVLRSLGAGTARVGFSFFFEPVLLSVPGIAGGTGLAFLFIGGAAAGDWVNIPIISLCYYAGVSAAVFHTFRKAAMISLSAENE